MNRSTENFTPSEGRRFAFPVGAVLLVIAAIALWRERSAVAIAIGVVAIALLFAGALIPARLGPMSRLWMRMAAAINRVTSPVVLGVLWFGIITPFALLARAFRRRTRHGTAVDSSRWVRRDEGKRQSDLRRQF